MKLHDLRPDPGSRKKRKRVGRGIAAGQGKTAGRGTKGQNARAGKSKGAYFEGGQLPLVRRLPFKRGFTNTQKVYYRAINLDDLVRIGSADITPQVLLQAGFLKKETDPFVILGEGKLKKTINVKAHRFSQSAKEKIEASGGSAEIISLA